MIIKTGGVRLIEQSKFLFNVRRIIGIRGRITIPYHIREAIGIKYNDVLSFSLGDTPDTIVVKKLKICNNCKETKTNDSVNELQKLLKEFSREDINKALRILEEKNSRGDKNV